MTIEGRIIKGVGGLYTVAAEGGRYGCSVRGIFRKRNFTPAVGDNVLVELTDEEKRIGVITRFGERRTELIRPRVVNVDQAIVVVAAARPDINTDLLDRFVLLAEESELRVLICINKSDLADAPIAQAAEYTAVGYRVLTVSAKTGAGIHELRAELRGQVSVLAGPSGAGKSSLINALLDDERMQTGELSLKIGRGKHTTRHTELLELFDGAFIVDTPGFTSLSLLRTEADCLDRLFREFRPYLGQCRFNDCRHISEPDCAVKAHIGNGILPQRYERYLTVYNELTQW